MYARLKNQVYIRLLLVVVLIPSRCHLNPINTYIYVQNHHGSAGRTLYVSARDPIE